MNSRFINYDQAHTLVDKFPNLFWEGWDIVEWKSNRDGFYKKNGMYRNGRWGTAVRYSPGDKGWKVPKKYVDE